MNDPRDTPSNGRVAHVSLKGKVDAERFTKGKMMRAKPAITPLLDAPDGARQRELLWGEPFRVLQHVPNYYSYGFAERDGYCGWVSTAALWEAPEPTHKVAVRQSYLKQTPDLKVTEGVQPLYFGSHLTIRGCEGPWSEVALFLTSLNEMAGIRFFIPTAHLAPVDQLNSDPVTVARMYLGAPYLWGGNSAFGIDCSGLVQSALLACGIPCPGDSDQQRAALGETLGPDDAPRRGDLYFWKGHVGLLSASDRLLHATAHFMSVVEEPLDNALARIEASEGLSVLRRARLSPPAG